MSVDITKGPINPDSPDYHSLFAHFFLEFRKFQLIESLELMRFSHFWGSWQPICHQSSKRPRRHGLVFNSLTRWKLNFQISE